MNAPERSVPCPDTCEMGRALSLMFHPDDVIEIRTFARGRGKRTDAGYFDGLHRPDLLRHAERLNRAGAAVYVTLNQIDPQLLGRYANRIEEWAQATTSDHNILRRNWLLLDFDPKRPKDTSATDEQLEDAKEQAFNCAEFLSSQGWPDPLSALSGNGQHLFYRIDLPNDASSTDLIKSVLGALGERFDTVKAQIDRSVFNAARIVKLPGTVANKGDHTISQPWRVSHLVSVPDPIDTVSEEQLRALLPDFEPQKTSPSVHPRQVATNNQEFNVDEFLSRLGIPYEKDLHNGAERYKLYHCPFNTDHGRGEAAVFRAAGGTLGFKCQHNGCADRRWRDLRELVDGPRGAPSVLASSGTGSESGATQQGKSRFPRVWLADARLDLTNTYIVKHLIDSRTLTLIYGPSGQGKTFFTIDLVTHIAGGRSWRGRRVRGCLVVYIAAEAGASIVKRFVARRDQEPTASEDPWPPLSIVTRGANLLNLADVDALMLELWDIAKEAGLPVGLVVFDTYSRSTPGGKEDAEDTSAAVAVADRLRDEFGAGTVFVHHSGKDMAKGARGHSSLHAAADTVVRVEGTTTAVVSGCVAEVEKARDGTSGEQIPFRLEVVELGHDEDGEPITTCVVVPTEGAVTSKVPKLSGAAKVALQALQEALSEHGRDMPGSSTIPRGRAVQIDDWRTRFGIRYGQDGKDQRATEAVAKAFQRSKEALFKASAIGVSDPYVWSNG